MNTDFKTINFNYICSGWLFFMPYIFIYLIFWIFGLPVPILLQIFLILHLLNLVLLLLTLWNNFNLVNWRKYFFWISVACLFIFPGVYLEYPSDVMEHVRRISQWEHLNKIDEGISHYKFSYFWTYSFINFTEGLKYKLVLDIYYTFIGLILVLQIYELGKKTIKSDLWTKVSVLIVIITYGNSSLNFFRYYGLSSTMLCLVGFLVFLNALLCYKSTHKYKSICYMLFGCILAMFNHPQSGLFIFSSLVSYYCYNICLKKGSINGLIHLLKIGCVTLLIFYISSNTFFPHEFQLKIQKIIDTNNWLYHWGGFKIISTNLDFTGPKRFLQILGVFGILNLFFSIPLVWKNEFIGWISLTPVFLLLYPPFALPFAYALDEWDTIISYHRILLVIPSGFCIVIILKQISELEYVKKFISDGFIAILLLTSVILASIIPNPLVYGRIISLLDSDYDTLNISELHNTASILKKKLILDYNSIIFSDSTTQFCVSSYLGLKNAGQRMGWKKPEQISDRIKKEGGLTSIVYNKEIKAVLCVNQDLNLKYHTSLLGNSSGHWKENFINQSLAYDLSTHKQLNNLLNHGWKKFEIPPWYDLYIPSPKN